MAEGNRTNLTLRLSTERYQALKNEAETMGMSINSLVVRIVDEHFVSPITVSNSSLLRSTYRGVTSSSLSSADPTVAAISTTYAEGISKLTDAYEDALRKFGGNAEEET